MSEETAVITRSKAISLINNSIEKFATYYDGYCSLNKENLTEEENVLCQQTGEVVYILRNDKNYRRDLEQMPLEDLTDFFLSCKEMVNFHDLLEKFSFPKEQVMIVEDTNINPELIEKSLEKLEQHGDVKINNAIKEYHEGERKIRFSKMPENQYGETWYINDKYSHFITENLIQDTPENQIKIAVTLAHEFKRNAQTDSISGETRDIVLEDTKIIESFANTYGEEIYKKFPEYGILHYIRKIFGEAELKDFADFAFDSTGNYWKVNGKGDLEDDADVSKVMDVNGKQLYSDTTGRQGTLENWLGISNAFITLLKPAGYEYDSEKKTWSKVPGKISHEIIEKAYKNGELTQDQYNLIQLAAGLISDDNDSDKDSESEKENIFLNILKEFYDKNIKNSFIDIAFKWITNKINGNIDNKNDNEIVITKEAPQNPTYLKQRPLEEKYGYPYDAPSFGSLCLATTIINLYILEEGLSEEDIEKFMNEAKGKFITPEGDVIDFEKMSKRLSELLDSTQYYDYVYYNPETKTYSAQKKAMTKDAFLQSDYEYGIGAYIHMDDDPKDIEVKVVHYELIKRSPFTEYNPGISNYQLYEIYPVDKYRRQ